VLAIASLYGQISLYAYLSTSFCMLYDKSRMYAYIYMPAHECLVLPMSCQVSLYVNFRCYMTISVYMPNALFHMLSVICQVLYAECYGLYAKFHMLDGNMPNAMTIAMSFSMTTEQVGHLIIYIYLLFGYDSPYCRYREGITIISPWLQFISQLSGISVC
jgi:hypothetical protein